MAKHNRRTTRPLVDLPNLFDQPRPKDGAEALFEVMVNAGDTEPQKADREFLIPDEYATPRPRLRFISFGSGSSGNCAYIGTPASGLLIDAGVDNNYVTAELARNGIDIRSIHGIILTHDHADHVRYAYSLLRRNTHMRLFCTLRTLEGLLRRHNISRRIKDYHAPVFKEHEYTLGDLTVTPFETSHDGTDNCGYSISFGGNTFVVATDMGRITDRADHYMRLATALMIEANYDDNMLEHGRYPAYLKARIRSEIGHMDNAVTARYLADTARETLTHIFLCHLSHDNNTPETALEAISSALAATGIDLADSQASIKSGEVFLYALPRFKSSDLFVL